MNRFRCAVKDRICKAPHDFSDVDSNTSYSRRGVHSPRQQGRPNAWHISLAVLVFQLAFPVHAGNFYLSSERVFAPGQKATVKLETAGVDELEFRVYELEDPRTWFNKQRDLHRPAEETGKPTFSTLSLLRIGAKERLQSLLRDVRKEFGPEGRQLLKKSFQSVHTAADTRVPVSPARKRAPRLSSHRLVDSWLHIPPARNGWIYDEIALPFSKPGAFLIEATDHKHIAHAVVLISDISIVTKQSAKELLVWTVNPGSGEPVPQVDVEVLVGGKTRFTERTDQDGLARIELEDVNQPVIYARKKNSFTLLDPQFYPAILPEPRTYVFTERPIYRPGQEVFWKGFARDMEGERYIIPPAATETEQRNVQVEAIAPDGKSWHRSVVQMSERGSFDGRFSLPEEPTMGTWQLVVTVNGKRHAGQFKVMSYVKPEVNLDVHLHDNVVRTGDAVAGEVEGSYFFGAPFPNAEVKITATRTRWVIPWYVDAEYSWYYSEAEYRNTRREVVFETTCTLDQDGRCPFEFKTDDADEDYTYVVEATATDPMGKTVSGSDSLQLTTGAFRLVLDTAARLVKPGQTQTLRIRAEDYSRRPVVTPLEIVISGKRLGEDGVLETVELARETLQTGPDGSVSYDLPTARGGYFEVDAKTKDDRGTKIVASTFLFVSEDDQPLPFSPDDIEIITDRRSYFAGDDALVLILTPAPASHVLFTVEGGDLYRAEVLQAKGHASLVRVPIRAMQTPNFYLSATTMVGDGIYTRTRNVVVPPTEQILSVEVAPDRPEARPGEKVTFRVHVTDAKGNPAEDVEVALSVVDEAIYAISSELAVPMEGFFFPRKRNNVRTSDSLSFRFFGYAKNLNRKSASLDGPRRNAFGAMKMQNGDARRVFRDTAAFIPSLVTDKNGDARTTISLPDNLTTWRATARVMSRSTQVGFGKGKLRVKKDLMLKIALPAHLQQGDSGTGKLWVQNLTDTPLDIDLRVKSRDLDPPVSSSANESRSDQSASRFVLTGNDVPNRVTLKARENRSIPFQWNALRPGQVFLEASARAGALRDELQKTFEVSEWARPVRMTATGMNAAGASSVRHRLRLPDSSELKDASLQVDLVASQVAAIRGALPYLVEYPWGCTEQTMSRFVPALAAQEVFKRLGLQLPKASEKRERALVMGQERVWQLQHDDGSWGWWEQGKGDVWMTAYVLDGLAQARTLGETLPSEELSRGVKALERLLARPGVNAETRAFGVFALAQMDKPQNAMIDSLSAQASKGQLTTASQAYLVESLHALGRKNEANEVAGILAARARQQDGFAWWDGPESFAGSWSAQNHPSPTPNAHPIETSALTVRALSRVGGYETIADAGEKWLLAQYDNGRFGTTRQSALVVRALALRLQNAPSGSAEVTIRVDGQESHRWKSQSASDLYEAKRIQLPLQLSQREIEIEIEKTGAAPLFHAIALQGVSRNDVLPASPHGLSVKRTYTLLSGETGAFKKGEAATEYRTGDAVLVSLQIESGADALDYVMLEDMRPATLFPIQNDQGAQLENIRLFSELFRREHRDDRTAFFFSQLPPGVTTVHYLARTGLPGEFKALPARAEAMYQPATYEGQSASATLRVTDK